MNRIFLTLASIGSCLLVAAFVLGLNIEDVRSLAPAMQAQFTRHFLTALGALIFVTLVHAIVFTYFIGTGRWLEETSQAYKLSLEWWEANRRLKYRILPLIMACVLLLIATASLGGAADPASPVGFEGWAGLKPATIHLLGASFALGFNLLAFLTELQAILQNAQLINSVMREVERIRTERGLPLSSKA